MVKTEGKESKYKHKSKGAGDKFQRRYLCTTFMRMLGLLLEPKRVERAIGQLGICGLTRKMLLV